MSEKGMTMPEIKLGQGWVSRVTNQDGPEESVLGAGVSPSAVSPQALAEHLDAAVGAVDSYDGFSHTEREAIIQTLRALAAQDAAKDAEIERWRNEALHRAAQPDANVAEIARLKSALEQLRIDANRLCDRNMGGTYEDDCRQSIANADAALRAS